MPAQDASSLPVYTALNIPTVTSYPSLKTVQWSADGQVCFISKNSALILTPDHGINFDSGSVIKSTPTKEDHALGWFKTMIQHDKVTPIRWPEYSQVWGAVSLGSIDSSLSSMAISPIGVSPSGGCVYASLSSNMDVNLWTAGKNYLKGEWLKISDISSSLLQVSPPAEGEPFDIVSILKAQTVCMEWTTQANFGLLPNPSLDSSFLVLGNRAGCLHFLRYRKHANPETIATLTVADEWVTQVAFSCWNLVKPGHCEGYLAYGLSGGSLGLVKITQILIEDTDSFSFTPMYKFQITLELASSLIHVPEFKAGITSLRWVDVPGRTPILVSSNPGIIKLWSASDDPEVTYWTGLRCLRIQTQKISADASALYPVSGISYLQKQDRLIVILFDGSFHVIRNFSSNPSWAGRSSITEGGEHHLTSEALSGVSRATFVKAEKGNVDRNDMVRVDGAVSYDGAGCFLWVYESARPSDFSYKHDAKQNSTLIVTKMWDDDDDIDLFLQHLLVLLNNVKTASGLSPLYLLRPFFLHLRDPAKLNAIRYKFLEVLQTRSHEDFSKAITVPSCNGKLTEDLRLRFKFALSTNLFGWDDLLSLRMRLSLADFAWKLASNEKDQEESGVVAQNLLTVISRRILRTILRHLSAVVDLLTPSDIPFASRLIVQSLLPGCPSDLAEEGKQLSVAIQPLIASSAADKTGSDEVGTLLKESCPACKAEVPFHDITTAVCNNGHTWARCSVTTFILSTPWVRTCVGCSRKAFLPQSANQDLPTIAQGWVVEDLLDAVHRCLFCNNAFVSVL